MAFIYHYESKTTLSSNFLSSACFKIFLSLILKNSKQFYKFFIVNKLILWQYKSIPFFLNQLTFKIIIHKKIFNVLKEKIELLSTLIYSYNTNRNFFKTRSSVCPLYINNN